VSAAPFDIALFAAVVRLCAPLLFAAVGELVSQKAGVINIGLEGMMLSGAFTGFVVAHGTGRASAGLLAGVLGGMLIGALMALFSTTLGGDQIVVGVALNLLVAGVTLFLYRLMYTQGQPGIDRAQPLPLPGLSSIPLVGPVLFAQLPLGYVAFLSLPVIGFLLYRTRTGLALRATGELPVAARTAGTHPARVQWAAVLFAGAMAGLGGTFLSVVQLGFFAEGMTAGRGYLALATVVFGRWRLRGVLVACLVFAATDALQLRLQSIAVLPTSVWVAVSLLGCLLLARTAAVRRRARDSTGGAAPSVAGAVLLLGGVAGFLTEPAVSLPAQVWLCLPYVLSLTALALTAGRSRSPAMVGRPLRREALT